MSGTSLPRLPAPPGGGSPDPTSCLRELQLAWRFNLEGPVVEPEADRSTTVERTGASLESTQPPTSTPVHGADGQLQRCDDTTLLASSGREYGDAVHLLNELVRTCAGDTFVTTRS